MIRVKGHGANGLNEHRGGRFININYENMKNAFKEFFVNRCRLQDCKGNCNLLT